MNSSQDQIKVQNNHLEPVPVRSNDYKTLDSRGPSQRTSSIQGGRVKQNAFMRQNSGNNPEDYNEWAAVGSVLSGTDMDASMIDPSMAAGTEVFMNR